MRAIKVTYKKESVESTSFGSVDELMNHLEGLNNSNLRIKDFLFVDLDTHMLVIRESSNSIFSVIENSFFAIAEFCDGEYDLDFLNPEDIYGIEIEKVVLSF